MSDLTKREGVAAAGVMAYLGAKGYVTDNNLILVPKIKSQADKKAMVKFKTIVTFDVDVTNSMFKYSSQGHQKTTNTKVVESEIIANPKGESTGEKIEIPVRITEDVKTFITDIKIKRSIKNITTEIISVQYLE